MGRSRVNVKIENTRNKKKTNKVVKKLGMKAASATKAIWDLVHMDFPRCKLPSMPWLSHHDKTVTDWCIYSLGIGRHSWTLLQPTSPASSLASQFSMITQKKKVSSTKQPPKHVGFFKVLEEVGVGESIQSRKCPENSLFFPSCPCPYDIHPIFLLQHLSFKTILNFPKPSQLSISIHSI